MRASFNLHFILSMYFALTFAKKKKRHFKLMVLCIFVLCFRKHCFFVDLFVRVSNKVAVAMYNKLGYTVYRRVLEYYSGDVDEDAFGKYRIVLVDIVLMSHSTVKNPRGSTSV